MKRWALFIPFGIFIMLGFFLYRGLFLDPRDIPSALVDKEFPEFNLPTLISSQAKTVNDIKGQAHLVNVWGTWCISCRVEHPFLVELAQKGVSIVGINYKDDNAAALKWLDDLGNPYIFSVDDENGTLSMDLGVTGAPETFFVDASGIIRHKHQGPITVDNWPELKKIWVNLSATAGN
ncbi:thiol:disulfide interchange protein [Bermanella sp. 47_1433_sub80_T6]|mgnify:FL=1|nr:thiol:disulfide interchange protein [Bermanella sp. 47_1433_sub80_T6]